MYKFLHKHFSYTIQSKKIFKSSFDVFNIKIIIQAIKDVKSGNKILSGGFGLCGIPENLLKALAKLNVKDLEIVSSNAGTSDYGLGILMQQNKIKRITASYVGENKVFEHMYLTGKLEVNFTPQVIII